MSEPFRLDAIAQELQDLADELNEEDIDAEQRIFEEELARRNRSGERGRDWAEIQQRIDINQTSLNAVLTGEDTSPAARRVMAHAQKNLSGLRDHMVEEAAQDEEAIDPLAKTSELLEEIDRKVNEIKSRFGSL